MRDGLEEARNAGTNLAFLGSDDGYWQVRYEDSYRTIVSYKSSADPCPDRSQTTTRFRLLNPPRPECELEGVQWQGGLAPEEQRRSYSPVALGDPWLAGAGLGAGDVLAGSVGYEWDAVQPGCHVPPV